MALDSLDFNCSKGMHRVSRGSGLSNLLQKDEQFHTVPASLFGTASSNLPTNGARFPHFNVDKYCTAAVHGATNSADTILKSLPQLQRISRTYFDSHVDFPKLPVLSPHELSILQSPAVDAVSTMQHMSFMDGSQALKRKQQPECLNVTSHHAVKKHEYSLPDDIKQEVHYSCLKKPRLDLNQGAVVQSWGSVQLPGQGQMALLNTLIQQNKLPEEHRQKYLQSIPQFQGVNLQCQDHQQMRDHLEQPDIFQIPSLHPFDGVCSRRLMQYVYHLKHRPLENDIAYWRKIVKEYYAPNAKRRWCLSLYDNVRHHHFGVFPKADVAQWHCDLCGSTSGRGFEVASEVLPRLSKVSFESGVMDEILFLDLPRERRFPSGLMMLEYDKAVQESVYERLRVVCEGKLRIIFTYDLKILSWEFCARHHEEFLQRSFIVPQVSQLAHAAQKYQSKINASNKVSTYDLQEDCNRFLTMGHQLVRNVEFELIEDLGFSKRYIRCLQIAGVVESMKDLMSFSMDNNIGPVECLKNYPRQTNSFKRGEGKEKFLSGSVQNPPTDKLMAQSPDFNNSKGCLNVTDNPHLIGLKEETPGKLSRQKTLTSNARKKKAAPLKCKRTEEDASTKPFQDPKTSRLGLSQDLLVTDLSSYNLSESSKNIQEYMDQQWLHEMIGNGREVNKNGKEKLNQGISCAIIPSGMQTKAKMPDKVVFGVDFDMATAVASRYSSSSALNMHIVSAASDRDSSAVFANDGFIKREPDTAAMVQNMVHDYYQNGNPAAENHPSHGWNVQLTG